MQLASKRVKLANPHEDELHVSVYLSTQEASSRMAAKDPRVHCTFVRVMMKYSCSVRPLLRGAANATSPLKKTAAMAAGGMDDFFAPAGKYHRGESTACSWVGISYMPRKQATES